MNFDKVGIVAQREFLATVKRKSYLVVTFGMPFFVSLYVGLVAILPTLFINQSSSRNKEIGVVDLAGVIVPEEMERMARGEDSDELRQAAEKIEKIAGPRAGMAANLLKDVTAPVRFRTFAAKDEGVKALVAGDIERLYVVPADWMTSGGIESYQSEDAGFSFARGRTRDSLGQLLNRSLMAGRVPHELRPRLENPISNTASEAYTVRKNGEVSTFNPIERVARFAIPGIFSLMFLLSVMISSGYLLQGVAEEKENRVIEIILSSVRPHQLLFGKLLGLGAAGLLQLIVWIAVGTMAVSLLAAAALAMLDFKLFAGCLLFFILGFLMLGSLMTGTGALGTNARESQQLATIWSMLTIMPPAFTWMGILDSPTGTLARILGWFPLTAPITMMLRLGTGKVPWWDVLVSIVILCGGVFVALRVSGGLFRLGLLMYGKRPTLREVIRQLRHA
ncbi:MAG TPA: ABC transporter permease [Verrucomicrobiae bacterium]|nr:ABC transporter permease [Verrucomicrobiae bacterium]